MSSTLTKPQILPVNHKALQMEHDEVNSVDETSSIFSHMSQISQISVPGNDSFNNETEKKLLTKKTVRFETKLETSVMQTTPL